MSGSIRRRIGAAAVGALALALAACASGPRLSELQESGRIPNPAPDRGRIYVYRTAVIGAAVQPEVTIDGRFVGNAVPDGVFYVDLPPGRHTVATADAADRKLRLDLAAGGTRYVRLDVGFGWMRYPVYPVAVAGAEGARDIAALHYTGFLAAR